MKKKISKGELLRQKDVANTELERLTIPTKLWSLDNADDQIKNDIREIKKSLKEIKELLKQKNTPKHPAPPGTLVPFSWPYYPRQIDGTNPKFGRYTT